MSLAPGLLLDVCFALPRPPPGHLQSLALSFPHQDLSLPTPGHSPGECTISSPSASHLPGHPDLLTIASCIEYSKRLLEKGERWFAPCPRPSRPPLSPEPPPAGALPPAHLHSDARPQSGVEGRPRSPSQECTAHSRSKAPHRGSWSVRSSGQRCPRHTCSLPPGNGVLITG